MTLTFDVNKTDLEKIHMKLVQGSKVILGKLVTHPEVEQLKIVLSLFWDFQFCSYSWIFKKPRQ